jgi:Ser/Thr protein kinase RdoA (MazF antagonist)
LSKELIKKVRVIPTLEQIIEICNLYGIGDLVSILKVIEDTANANITILTKTGTYVIRIFSADAQRADFILSILRTLAANEVPVLMPLKNIEGKYYIKFGSKNLQITRFKHGQCFEHNKKQAWSSGKTLYKFHDALTNVTDIVKPRASIYPSINVIKEGITKMEKIKDEDSKEEIDLIKKLYNEIVEKWESKCENIPQTIIHGDWHQGNQLYTEAGNVCCIMDFDFITRAERLFDIAYALWHFRVHKEGIGIAKAFMEGYGYDKLSNQEIKLLPLELARINYFFMCTSVLSLNPEYELKNQFKQQYPFLKWALSENGKNTINYLCKKNDFK